MNSSTIIRQCLILGVTFSCSSFLIHLSKYTRPETLNPVRELSRFGGKPIPAHYKAMMRCMKYCTTTKRRGLKLQPYGKWDGKDRNYKFEIMGKSDSTYASCQESRRSVSGWAAYLNGAAYTRKSKMQPSVTMSVTEAEAVAAASCVMDMIYGKEFLESLGLQIKLPMVLKMDNKGAVDLFNGWSVSGNTRHISTRICFIRELKEAGILSIVWCPGAENAADLFTKNLDREAFEKHAREFIDIDAEIDLCSDAGGTAPEHGGVLEVLNATMTGGHKNHGNDQTARGQLQSSYDDDQG